VLRSSGSHKIAEVLVREGARVRRGDVLLRFDTQTSPDRMARISQVTEAYENAKRQVERLEPLFAAGAVAESDLDAARTQLAIAEADLRNSRLELDTVSPIDGVVTLIAVRAGDSVNMDDVIAQVAVLDSIRVVADVSGETARGLFTGAPVSVEVSPGAGAKPVRSVGRLTRVALAADPDSRLFRVEAVVKNAGRALRPGVIVSLDVVVDRVGPVAVAPQAAILGSEAVTPGSSQEVYAVEGGVARLQTIEIGRTTEDMVEVRSGLRVGDHVVVFGSNLLADGKKVKYHKIDGVLAGGSGEAPAEGADAR
jgi:RND family efflux transporter MFP subunit